MGTLEVLKDYTGDPLGRDENSFLWLRSYDPKDATKLVSVTKALRIKGAPSSYDARMFVTQDDVEQKTEKFMLFVQDKQFMVGMGVPEAEEYDFLMYRVFEVDWETKTLKSAWWEKTENENVAFERCIVYPGISASDFKALGL